MEKVIYIVIAIVFLVLAGYVLKILKDRNKANRIKELNALRNICRLQMYDTQAITEIGITRDYEVSITMDDEYAVYLPLNLFSNFRTEDDLNGLDNFVAILLQNKPVEDNEKDSMDEVMKKMKIVEKNFEKKITAYLKNYNIAIE